MHHLLEHINQAPVCLALNLYISLYLCLCVSLSFSLSLSLSLSLFMCVSHFLFLPLSLLCLCVCVCVCVRGGKRVCVPLVVAGRSGLEVIKLSLLSDSILSLRLYSNIITSRPVLVFIYDCRVVSSTLTKLGTICCLITILHTANFD